MSTKTPISLTNFFVFNSRYGPREGEEHLRVLYFYPPDTDLDTKIKATGLCEAIIKFTETFSDKDTESMHTQKHRQLFFQPEKDFWLIMTVSIPHSQKIKEGQTYLEYHEEDVPDSVFHAILRHAYNMFKLFMGTFENIVEKNNKDVLLQRLDHFFSRYLLTLRLNQSDILDVFCGLHFLPLDKNTYLRIQCFINQLEATFTSVTYTVFLYNDQLVWSGLEQDDMRVLYRYLTTSLLPCYNEQELHGSQAGGATSGPSVITTQAHYGKFISGPPNMKDESNLGKVARVYLNTDVVTQECHLVVYKALSATICLLVEGSQDLTYEFYRRVDTFLGPQLSTLASDIGEHYSRRPSVPTETVFKYVYFNHMNLAQKTTIHNEGKKSANTSIPPDTFRLIADLNHDLNSVTNVEDGETIVKTCTDCWVVGKKSDQREFYVIINQKNANLIEINEEVKRMCASNFSNIFFLD